MKIDATLTTDLLGAGSGAAALEAAGYDGLWVGETAHDPFLRILQAGNATATMTVGTSVAIAFARTPMVVASTAYDLQCYTAGRFVLGLGSQIQAHIEKRFSMPWGHPAARMGEFVLALRAIWNTWETGEKLQFRGEFYQHTLMTPFFSPPKHAFGPPPVYVAGVAQRMTETAGEVADGFFMHAFTTARYLREVTIPALERGRAKAGRTMEGFVVAGPSFVTIGRDDAELAEAITGTKKQIAFYASTPAYRAVLDLHGWGDLQPELNTMTKQGRWDEIGDLVTDEMVEAFSVVGSPEQVGKALRDKLDGLVDRVQFYAPYAHDPAIWTEVLAAFRGD
jgi:probable F420-dependent oxidoreductase